MEEKKYERKIEDGELVGREWHDEQVAILLCERNNLANYVKELQEEIERLTEEKWQLQDDLDNYHAENTELRKQVDELKEERYYTEQDTAKEILQEVLEDIGEFYAGDIVEELAKRYGLEVE